MFLTFSSFTKICNSDNSSKILFLASNLSRPIYFSGAFLLIFPSSVKIFIFFNFCLSPTSKSLKSWAGVILTAPVPCSGSAYSSWKIFNFLPTIGSIANLPTRLVYLSSLGFITFTDFFAGVNNSFDIESVNERVWIS